MYICETRYTPRDMNTFKMMMIGRLCLLLILRTHEQRAFIIFCFFVFFFLRIDLCVVVCAFEANCLFMKERADVFDGISLLSPPFCSSFFFSRLEGEDVDETREGRELRNKSLFIVFFEERAKERQRAIDIRYDDNDFQSALSTSTC